MAMSYFTCCNFEERYRRSLVDLYKEVWKEQPWNEFFWTSEMVNEDIDFALSQKDFIGKLALNSNSVIGFTWGYKLPFEKFSFLKGNVGEDTIYIDELAVKSGFRRRKVGSVLTDLLTKNAMELGYNILTLRTDINGIAYGFYRKLGFRDMKIRDPQYQERTYMEKTLR